MRQHLDARDNGRFGSSSNITFTTRALTTHRVGTQCNYGGYRKFLKPGSRGRFIHVRSGGHTYQFGGPERLPTPAPRTLHTVIESLRCVEVVGRPHAGHKFPPLQAQWPGFDWFRYNGPELAHGRYFTFTD